MGAELATEEVEWQPIITAFANGTPWDTIWLVKGDKEAEAYFDYHRSMWRWSDNEGYCWPQPTLCRALRPSGVQSVKESPAYQYKQSK